MKNKLTSLFASVALLAATPFAFSATTLAQTLTFNYDRVTELNVASPVGTAPWLTATFTQVSPDTITLKLTADLTDSEFISKLGFNLSDGIEFDDLTFSLDYLVGNFTAPDITDQLNGGQGTRFDIGLNFATAPPSKRFNLNDSLMYSITYSGSNTFNPSIFNVLDSGKNSVVSIAHVQSIGSKGTSAWISPTVIPEPKAAFLGAFGLLALLRRRR